MSSHSSPGRGHVLAGGDGPEGRSLLPDRDEGTDGRAAAPVCSRPGCLVPYYADADLTLYIGDSLDVLRQMPASAVDCIVTSPPYFGLRDYGVEGQYGLEGSPSAYVETMRAVFAEARRVLADDGTLWLNLGDSYSVGNVARHNTNRPNANRDGSRDGTFETFGAVFSPAPETHGIPAKNLLGIPWRVAFALQDDGWTLRNAIVWHKPNAMPESVTDRLSCDYEQVFLFSKSRRYYFDLDAIREPLSYPDALDGSRTFGGANKGTGEGKVGAAARRGGLHKSTYGAKRDDMPLAPGQRPHPGVEANDRRRTPEPPSKGRNPGSVWDVATQPFPAAHFAVMPTALAERCILAGCKPGGVVLDPFSGSGTTGMAAAKLGRRYVGIDLNRDYLDLSLRTRLGQVALCDAPQAEAITGEAIA